MKTFFGALFITLAIISTIILLPTMLPKTQYPTYTDDELRKIALKEGLYAVPQTDQELLELVDNPNNLMSTQKIVLGKKLFNDKNLSYDRDLSCASCHILKDGGDDNIPTAIGHNKQKNPSHLNSPTVLNSAIATRLFWDGSAKDLEAQAAGPIQAHFEMNMKPQHIVQRVNQNDQYKEMFKQIFGQNAVTFENVKKAIASYERTLLTYG
ncbi:MAG: cytochrome-c peroxidase, partial [Campylobacterota bacterium]|nr:cytochrome-c peroxidase [Campylobacterota bacterium]